MSWEDREERSARRSEPKEIEHVKALRPAGRALVVVVFDPKNPDAVIPREREVMIPVSEILFKSQVKKQGDKGTLLIPLWLAVDRHLADEED